MPIGSRSCTFMMCSSFASLMSKTYMFVSCKPRTPVHIGYERNMHQRRAHSPHIQILNSSHFNPLLLPVSSFSFMSLFAPRFHPECLCISPPHLSRCKPTCVRCTFGASHPHRWTIHTHVQPHAQAARAHSLLHTYRARHASSSGIAVRGEARTRKNMRRKAGKQQESTRGRPTHLSQAIQPRA